MRDLAQTSEQLFQDFWSQHKRVTAGEKHIAHLWCAFEIIDLHLKILAVEGLTGVADNARACAVTAVRGALSRYEHEHSVWISVNKPWHGRVAVLRQRVLPHGCERVQF